MYSLLLFQSSKTPQTGICSSTSNIMCFLRTFHAGTYESYSKLVAWRYGSFLNFHQIFFHIWNVELMFLTKQHSSCHYTFNIIGAHAPKVLYNTSFIFILSEKKFYKICYSVKKILFMLDPETDQYKNSWKHHKHSTFCCSYRPGRACLPGKNIVLASLFFYSFTTFFGFQEYITTPACL